LKYCIFSINAPFKLMS